MAHGKGRTSSHGYTQAKPKRTTTRPAISQEEIDRVKAEQTKMNELMRVLYHPNAAPQLNVDGRAGKATNKVREQLDRLIGVVGNPEVANQQTRTGKIDTILKQLLTPDGTALTEGGSKFLIEPGVKGVTDGIKGEIETLEATKPRNGFMDRAPVTPEPAVPDTKKVEPVVEPKVDAAPPFTPGIRVHSEGAADEPESQVAKPGSPFTVRAPL